MQSDSMIQGFKMFIQGSDPTQVHIIAQQHNMHQHKTIIVVPQQDG